LEEAEENLFWQLLGRCPVEDATALLERHTLLVFMLWKEEAETYLSLSVPLLERPVSLAVQAIYTSPE